MNGLIRTATLLVTLILLGSLQAVQAADHTITVSPVVPSQSESAGPFTFRVEITPGLEDSEKIVVSYQTADGSATAGSDYTATSGTLTFTSASSDPQTISVPIVNDAVKEPDETVELRITAAVPSGTDLSIDPATVAPLPAPAIGTITNDDYVITLDTSDETVKENKIETSTWTYEYTVKIDRAPDADTVTVHYATVAGSATAGSDFIAASGTLVFDNSTGASRTIPVTIINDALREGIPAPSNETFSVQLSSPSSNATINDASATTTITDNDHDINISADFHVHEGAGPPAYADFEVIAVPALAAGETVTVNYTTANGSAAAGSDFTATSGTLELTSGAGGNPKTISVPILNDAISEGPETFSLNLSNASANATITDTQSIATIDDNDDYIVSITNRTVNEDDGTAVFDVEINKHPVGSDVIRVDFATQDGTAHGEAAPGPGVDYITQSGSIEFDKDSTDIQHITVAIRDDAIKELQETYQVKLSNPTTNATLFGTGIGSGGINDDDYTVTTFNDVIVNEGDGTATLTVVLNDDVSEPVSLDYTTATGTAGASDFTTTSGTVTINTGKTGTFTIPISDDGVIEHDEAFTVNLTADSDNVTATAPNDSAQVTIQDNDKYTVTITDESVSEEGTTVDFTITISPAIVAGDEGLSIDWSAANGSAISPDDFSTALPNQTVTFGLGESSKTATVTIKEDTLAEGNENFFVNLTANHNADLVTFTKNQGIGTIEDDEYTITPKWNLHGTVTLQSPSGTDVAIINNIPVQINNNEEAIFTATATYGFTPPNPGPNEWSASADGHVTKGGGGLTQTFKFDATTPITGHTLNILFDHKIDYTATGDGTVTPTAPVAGTAVTNGGPLEYITDHNSTPTFAISAGAGQCTTDLKIDGVSQGAFKTGEQNWKSRDYTFAAVTDNRILEAIFDNATVTVQLGADDGATGTDEDTYIQANPNTGWRAYKADSLYNFNPATDLIKTGKHGDSFSIPGDTGGSCDERYFVIQYFDLDGWLKPADTKLDLMNTFVDQTVLGLYDANSHQLKIVADPDEGSVTVDPVGDPGGDNIYIYAADTNVILTPVANLAEDWYFQTWQGDIDGGTIDATTKQLTIKMDKDRTIEPVFVKGCEDLDGDGYKAPPGPSGTCDPGPQVDCNDGDPAINPGMTEICGNSVDDDCSGTSSDTCSGNDKDDDGDGFTESQGDCNDTPSVPPSLGGINIYPGATEIPDNGIDEDCFDGDKEIGVEETCVTPSDVPANAAKKPAPPLIMFLLDDSGSMEWEFMTSEYYQLYESRYFLFAYHQNSRGVYGDSRLDAGQRREYLSQFAGYNRLYFNPTTNYDPWPKWVEVAASVTTTGTERVLRRNNAAAPENGIEKQYNANNLTFPDIAFTDEFVHADMDNPRTNTVRPGAGYPMAYIDRSGVTQTMDLNAEFFRVKNLPQQVTVERTANDPLINGADTRADAIGLSTTDKLDEQYQGVPPKFCTDVNNNVPALIEPGHPVNTCYELSPWGNPNRPDAPEIIFDNSDTTVFSKSSYWSTASGASYWQWGENSGTGKVGTSFWTHNTGTWASWRMNAPANGEYYIYAWINDFANSDGKAKYTITYFNTVTSSYASESVYANQRPDNPTGGTVEGPRWIKIGNKKYYFKAQAGGTDIIVPNAHYFTWYDADSDGVRDNKEIYLVTIPGSGRTVGSYTLNYYRFDDINKDLRVDNGELTQLIPGVDDTEINRIKPVRLDQNSNPITDDAQLAYVVRQNFADWFSFYRRRILTAKAAVGLTVYDMERVSLGIYAINRNIHEPLRYMEVADSTLKINYLRTLYSTPAPGNTPLRRGLAEVGQYFLRGTTGDNANLMTNEGLTSASDSPAANASVFWDANGDVDADTIDDSGGECQRAFVIAMTDGYYNDGHTIANYDRDLGTTFSKYPKWPWALQDTAANGLSDIANYYYRTDLDSGLADELEDKGFDDAAHQHLVMYGVSFGVFGNFNPNMYPDCLPECTTPGEDGCPELDDIGKIIPGTTYVNRVQNPTVPLSYTDTPTTSTGPWANACPRWNTTNNIESPAAVDDLFHASVNARGKFLNAGDPAELVDSLKKIKDLIEESQGTAASVSINANKIEANTLLYQTSYDSGDWSGDVEAKCLDAAGNIASCEAVSCSSACDTAYATCSALCTIGDTACEQVCSDARKTCYDTTACESLTCSAAHTACINGCPDSCTSTCTTIKDPVCVSGCGVNATCIDACPLVLDNACYTSCTANCKTTCDTTKATCSDDPPEIKWSAGAKLETVDWDDRNIITADSTGSGLPFKWGDTDDTIPDGLTNAMKTTLGGNEKMLQYLRGDNSCEAGNTTGCTLNYRVRSSKLGDFINSEPYYFKDSTLGIDWVFAGANDGMLHVLNGSTGEEVFAFVPHSVFNNLKDLASPGYNSTHKFFVDGYVTAQDLGDATILVGGLGKGGKGFYALDLDAATAAVNADNVEASTSAQSIVKWEYNALTQGTICTKLCADDDACKAACPASTAPIVANLGYSYSRPQIVKSNDPSAAWLLVFGNGYDSPSGHAVLFLLGLDTAGDIVWTHMIDTGVGDPLPANNNCNGLSTPALILPQGDGTNDFIFAGDLLGNMWKFDISSDDRSDWGVYFKDDLGVNKPLFEARSNPTGTTLYRQPITMKPDVTTSCINGTEGYLVAFGTGRLLDPEVDNLDQSIQTMYGIWDWSAEWALQVKDPVSGEMFDPHRMYLGHFMAKNTTFDGDSVCNDTCDAELGSTSAADTCLFNCLGDSECELECVEEAESCNNNCDSVRNLSNMENILNDAGSAQYVALLEQRQVSVLGLKYNSDGSIKEQIYGETNLNAVDEIVRTVSDNEINWLLPMENDGKPTTGVDADGDPPNELDLFLAEPNKKISHVGWYFDLPENGERAVKDVRIASGKLIFTTNTPSSSPCVGGGTSQIWGVEACTGGRSKHAYFDLNGDGVIDEYDYINIGTDADPIWIAPSSVKLEGIVPSPTLVEVQRSLDRLFFPDSREDSGIGSLGTTGYGLPIRYWRELDWQ